MNDTILCSLNKSRNVFFCTFLRAWTSNKPLLALCGEVESHALSSHRALVQSLCAEILSGSCNTSDWFVQENVSALIDVIHTTLHLKEQPAVAVRVLKDPRLQRNFHYTY